MTQKEIQVLVERGLHTKGYLRVGNIDSQILDLYLNQSINKILDSILEGLRNGNFEDSIIRMEDTIPFKTIAPMSKLSPNTVFTDGEVYTLSGNSITDYRDWIKFRVDVTSEYASSAKSRKIRIYDEEVSDELLEDTFHKTTYKSPVGFMYSRQIRVYTNSDYTLGVGELVYLKKPVEFNVGTDGDVEYEVSSRVINAVIAETVAVMLKDSKLLEVSN